MESVSVDLGERAYPIHIGEGLLADAGALRDLLAPCIRGRQVALFSNAAIDDLYGAQVRAALADFAVDTFVMGDGEGFKSLETYAAAMDFLMDKRHNRTTCLIALGGGVVGDLTGFVAATFQRGVDFVQIPTTLLAQVDAAVGGKTGVNLERGKNLAGTFHQPVAVVADGEVLATLDPAELRSGLGEVVKAALLDGEASFARLEASALAALWVSAPPSSKN